MIISHKHKFIFYKPLKVGGSSVEVNLIRQCGDDDIITGSDMHEEKEGFNYIERNVRNADGTTHFHMHTPPPLVRLITGNSCADYFNFTIVRNPWDVAVSYFWWCVARNNINYKTEFNSIDKVRHQFSIFIDAIGHFDSGPRNDEGEHRIIEWLGRTNSEYCDGMNFIMRYENLQGDYEKACTHIGIPSEQLPFLKNTQRHVNMHYSEYYNQWGRDQVNIFFHDIIDTFGYTFDSVH